MKIFKVILIGNYKPDNQESMFRFQSMLEAGFEESNVSVEVWYPTLFFGRLFKTTLSGIGKWFGYIDKWVIFPLVILFKRSSAENVRYHICDHSNAPYVSYLPKKRTSITCHDVLAIRGALGHKDAYCPASSTGKILQKWILRNLLKAEKIASVSNFTHNQLVELNGGVSKPGWQVIHNGFNAGFQILENSDWKSTLISSGQQQLLEKPYIVHVGSNLQRKNRAMLIKMVAHIADKWDGYICFTGQVMNEELNALAKTYSLTDRIVEIKKPSHKNLEALINGAQAFVFPSFSEGFGWPVIEAQACGTPVIASNLQPMPEVGGNGAIYADPYSVEEFANSLLEISGADGIKINDLLSKSLENIERFDSQLMNSRYLELIKS